MSQTTVDVTTPRGTMPTYVHRPDGDGPFPRVVLYMDAPGIRPALFGHAERLAGAGYTAILPDLYYPFDPADRPNAERMAAGDPEEFARMRKLVGQIHDDEVLEDTRLLLEAVPERRRRCVGMRRLLHGRPLRDARGRGIREPTSRRRRCCTPPVWSPTSPTPRISASIASTRRCTSASARTTASPPSRRSRRSASALEQAGVAHRIEILARRRARLHDAGEAGLRRGGRRAGVGRDAHAARASGCEAERLRIPRGTRSACSASGRRERVASGPRGRQPAVG